MKITLLIKFRQMLTTSEHTFMNMLNNSRYSQLKNCSLWLLQLANIPKPI